MNSLIKLGIATVGMKGYKKLLRTQNIEVKYANSYRLRLQSNRWKNKHIHHYLTEQLTLDPAIEKVGGSPELGTLLFVFYAESLTEEEFAGFLEQLVALTDEAYQCAPVTLLNRAYDEKQKVNKMMRRASMGLMDIDTAIFAFTAFQGIKRIQTSPQAALGFFWWSYSILERANRRRFDL